MKHGDRPAAVSEDDWASVDVPEATDAEFAGARRFADAHPHLATTVDGTHGTARSRLSLRLPSDVVGAIKATGAGYSRRVEKVLRRALADGELAGD